MLLDNSNYSESGVIKVSCDVKNTGNIAGAEVVQVYVGKSKSKVERVVKELKGFDKLFLKPGESKSITIKIPVDKLKYYDESISDWSLEKGNYLIYLGNASDNIIEKAKFKVQ